MALCRPSLPAAIHIFSTDIFDSNNMDGLTTYQRGDIYLLSALSIFCVCLIIGIKFDALWRRDKYLIGLLAFLGVLELAALTLFSLESSRGIELPSVLVRSVHKLLVTISLAEIAMIQVSWSL